MMKLTHTFASRLHRVWVATQDPAKIAAQSATWLLGVAEIKWITQPISVHGMSAVVAAAAAAWYAHRRRVAA